MLVCFYGKICNGLKVFLFCYLYYLRYYYDLKNIGMKRCMIKEVVIFLFIVIVVEVIVMILLKLLDSFMCLVLSFVIIIGYCIVFWCFIILM